MAEKLQEGGDEACSVQDRAMGVDMHQFFHEHTLTQLTI